MRGLFAVFIAVVLCVPAYADGIADHLQNISVTISAGGSQGSGVTVVRGDGITFVWTAAHVVDGLRKTREIIDSRTGTKRTVVEFIDPKVVKILVENGRTVGRMEFDAEVIRYSDSDDGEDLALLKVRKKGFAMDGAKFYLEDKIPDIGTPLFHVGSLLGSVGANSMTSGIVSQQGRLIGKTVYDQTTVTAFPGCLTADAMVTLADGSEMSIASIQGGGEVLSYDSRVVMADGTWSRSIKEGDQVLSFQTITGEIIKKTGSDNLRPVTRGRVEKAWPTGVKPVFKISTRNRNIKATGNHPFVRVVTVPSVDTRTYHIAQWCRADELKPGDVVAVMQKHVEYRKSDGINLTHTFGKKENHLPEGLKFERIASIEPAGEEMTYDIAVKSYHNFFANGFLVHNSSGGGVYLTDGRYVGCLVRGSGEQFNLIVPVRRMRDWAKRAGVMWALDPAVAMPTEEELQKLPIEDSGVDFQSSIGSEKKPCASHAINSKLHPFLIHREKPVDENPEECR